jgi:hypothetical protein
MSNVPWHAEVVAFSKEVAALVSLGFRFWGLGLGFREPFRKK